jgi:patatin-like phospholipase/acyl hydrolase
MLQRIEGSLPGFLAHVDLFAGTSTGGLLALGLAAGLPPAEMIKLYENYGSKVFSDSVWDDARDLGMLIGADYAIEPLKEVLRMQFGNLTLGDLKKQILISSYDLDNEGIDPNGLRTWKAKFFHNYPGDDSDAGSSLVDVGLRTSAAPTFFPVYQGYIDGGVVASNPSMCALAQALHPTTGGQHLDEVVLFSLGTGHNPRYLEPQDGDWGLVQWAPHLINLMLEGGAGLADYQCRQILGARYMRINPLLNDPIGMDQVERIPEMWGIASRFDLKAALDWIKEYFLLESNPAAHL